jgi:hypothetical protein
MVQLVSKTASVPKIFDPSKLDAMNEPLFVRVEKTKGGARTPIPLPVGDDGTQGGTGWSKDDVRGIEGWLVNDWSGGGAYTITVTDSSLPTPQKHDWSIFYHPNEYPEKVPPTLAAAAGAPSTSPPQQVRPMGSFPSAFPNGLPGGFNAAPAPTGQPTTVYVPQPYYQPQPQPQPQPYRDTYQPTNIAATAAIEAERRRYEEQMREMQGQLARQREEMLQAQFRQELDRKLAEAKQDQAATEARFSRMEQLMEKVISASTAKPATDPAIEQLKEQNRMLAAQADNERRERETERREREMRDLIQRQQEDTRRQIEAMNAQMALAATNKTDPMIMFMQENARQQVEAVKEQARNATAQMTQMQAYMMNPRDVMAMAKESSNGLDQATRSITSTYQSILEMQRNAVEQILQLNQGGGSETIQLIEKGLDRASSFAERFIGGKTKEAVSAQTAQAQLAQANAAAMQAQAQAMATQASMQRHQAQQTQLIQAQPDSGLNGARVPSAPMQASVPPKPDWSTGPMPVPGTVQMIKRVLGHTDEEWFGPILPRVIELREGVAKFIESISMQPPRLKPDGTVEGVEPEQAASVILQAAMLVMQQQIPIAAMIDLLGQGRVADFMDVLLPEAPQPYRDEVAQMVLTELQGGGDDDEEDEEDGEDEEESEAPATVAAVPPTKPAPRARA